MKLGDSRGTNPRYGKSCLDCDRPKTSTSVNLFGRVKWPKAFPRLRDTLFGLTLLLVSSCSGAQPEILFTDWQLISQRRPDDAVPTEHLRLFVAVSDADGVRDIERILVVHEASELYWELTQENWVQLEYGGDEWIGAHEIRVPAGSGEMLRGRYSVEVYDAAQGVATDSFFVNLPRAEASDAAAVELRNVPVPTLVAPDGAIMRAYGSTGEVLFQESLSAGPLGDSVLERLRSEPGSVFYLERRLPSGSQLVVGPFATSSLE